MGRMICRGLSRRRFLAGTVAFAGLAIARKGRAGRLGQGTSTTVAIARCRRYDFGELKSRLAVLFDQLGGIGNLVNGKTVTVKVNLTGGQTTRVYTLPAIETVFTHPLVTLAACSLFHDLGARRIVVCDSLYSLSDPRTAFYSLGYNVDSFESAVPGVEWENTRNLGSGTQYRTITIGSGAYVYNSFQVNHRYVDTDVFVSIPKMKNHDIAGITVSMKNLFGITPSSLYSASAVNENSNSNRALVLHEGASSPAGGEVLPVPSTDPGYRIPRIVVDLVRARPVDLCIVDAIVSMHGGEGQWTGTKLGIVTPGLLIAGRNPVSVDAVCARVMGYDPRAARGNRPFFNGDNMLELAANRGAGTNEPEEIGVLGLSIASARYDFLHHYIK